MNELKVYTKQTTIHLFNGDPVVTTADATKIAEAINSGARLIEVGGDYIAASNVSLITSRSIGEMESFILNFDRDTQSRIRSIIKKREAQGLKINIDVVKNAYLSTYGQDLDNNQ